MKVVFGILFVAAFCMSICCFIAPKAVTVWYFFPFSILFAALFGKGYILRLRSVQLNDIISLKYVSYSSLI
jgi:hypothetical protein